MITGTGLPFLMAGPEPVLPHSLQRLLIQPHARAACAFCARFPSEH